MSITVLARLAYRALQRRMLQSALFVFSIVAGVALVVGVDVAAESARRAFSLSVASLQGNATHEIVGGPSGVPSSLYRTLRVDLGIRAASPAVQGTVRTGEQDIVLTLLGIDPFAESQMRQFLSGAAPSSATGVSGQAVLRLLTEPNTVIVSESVAARLGIQPGDQFALYTAQNRETFTLVGIIRPWNELSALALSSLVIADIVTAQEFLDTAGQLTRIDLILSDTQTPARIRRCPTSRRCSQAGREQSQHPGAA